MRSYDFLPKEELERYADKGNRHRSGDTPSMYLKHWLKLFRPTAFATQDDSWGELEKLISIFFTQAVLAGRSVREIFEIEDMRHVTPAMIQHVKKALADYSICPNCDEEFPGQKIVNGRWVDCPRCNGSHWVKKDDQAEPVR